MQNRLLLSLLITLLLSAVSTVNAATIERNLSFGDSGSDVLQLQKILNSDPDTIISRSGPGSHGNETEYFGQLTRLAVIRYQEKYREQILTPNGLTKGTGLVGISTRKHLAQRMDKPEAINNVPTPVKIPTAQNNPLPTSTTIATTSLKISYLIQPSTYSAQIGQSITISGFNLPEKNNSVIFKNTETELNIDNLPSPSRNSLNLKVPDLPFGKYDLWLKNEHGKSEFPTFITITRPNADAPIIEKVSPSSGGYGSIVTITGKNFSPKGNEIRTNYRIISDISSPDGKTLTVPMRLFPDIPQLQTGTAPKQNITLPVFFIIANENGISDKNKPGEFKLEL